MRVVVMMVVMMMVVVMMVVNTVSSSNIKLVDNGYENVVVAISPSLDESLAHDIVSSIKETLTEASEVLFRATRNRTYFRDIKILLPKSWTETEYDELATNENFEDSDIRVDERNMVYGDQPYTVQPGGCGEPGQYIHLTPQYLTDETQVTNWGPRGRMLIHEWAKLRWGVFDEFGYPNDPKFPLFYVTSVIGGDISTGYHANDCTNKELIGELKDVTTGGSCRLDNGLPNDDCRFIPYNQQEATSSLMSYYYLSDIVDFCDSSSSEEFSHSEIAPNKQNLMCEGRSVWDVVRLHQDFLNGTNAAITASQPPVFKVVSQEEAKFALVLDHSNSMSDYDRIHKLQRAAQRWILYEVADGSSVCIITFSTTARLVQELTVISNTTREVLANMIDDRLDSSTSIGAGLKLAVNVLNGGNSVILLITDGEENTQPMIADVMDTVVASGTRVVSIAFGEYADPKLESIAENTNGKTFTVLDTDDGGMLDDAFQAALTYQPADSLANTTVKIYESEYQGNETNVTGAFTVDFTVGRNLVFRFVANHNTGISNGPYLLRPNGTIMNTTLNDATLNMWTIKVPLAEEGTWAWQVEFTTSDNYARVDVTAQARDSNTLPILTRAWLSAQDNVNATATPIIIYAEVKQGNNPVVGARVRAEVTQPIATAQPVLVDLLDNGQAADNQAGDGVYSRYLTSYSTTGRYSVKAEVWDDGSSYINNGFIVSRQPARMPTHPASRAARAIISLPLDGPSYCCGSVVPWDLASAQPTGAFTRTASAGSVQVIDVAAAGGDSLPPSRVTDLQATVTSTTLNLTWTAPGDDYDAGTVSGYEVRMSVNRSSLLDASLYNTNILVLLSYSDSSNMSELLLEAGHKVNLYLDNLEELQLDKVYYLALRALDDFNNTSPVSNLVTAMVPPASSPDTSGMPVWAIVVLVAVAFIVAVVALVGYMVHKRK
ncbi:calcium-activated chloride channel regulator 4 isoform X1 [Cherax quadricarinatus]|uniref:calcium-activated chloride channel regulator 4 isoform X1 n=1 Tax=Cherax quadricarinatus TaxID=27406 RepID=UPI00387E3866